MLVLGRSNLLQQLSPSVPQGQGVIAGWHFLGQVLPSCTMLHYAAADLKEAEGAIAEADAVYSALTTQLLPEGDDLSDNPAPQVCFPVALILSVLLSDAIEKPNDAQDLPNERLTCLCACESAS